MATSSSRQPHGHVTQHSTSFLPPVRNSSDGDTYPSSSSVVGSRRRLVLHTPAPALPTTLRSRSSSLPLLQPVEPTTNVLPTQSMGLGHSKQLPPTPPPSELDSQDREKREGNKLRRAFASRKKESKSEDDIPLGVVQSQSQSQAMATRPGVLQVPVVPPKLTKSLPNPNTATESNGAGGRSSPSLAAMAPAYQPPPGRVPTPTTTTTNPRSIGTAASEVNNNNKGLPSAPLQHSTPNLIPPPLSIPPLRPSSSNRTSVIPLSPGITSAVNYMMLQSPIELKEVDETRADPNLGAQTSGVQMTTTTGSEDGRGSISELSLPLSAGLLHQREQQQSGLGKLLPENSTVSHPTTNHLVAQATTELRPLVARPITKADNMGSDSATSATTSSSSMTDESTRVGEGHSTSHSDNNVVNVDSRMGPFAKSSAPHSAPSLDAPSVPAPIILPSISSSMPPAPSSPPIPKRLSNPSSISARPRPLSQGTTSTARAGSISASRPVSWAESFQSACTVVPGSGDDPVNPGRRRLSALVIGVGGEGWPEEDEDDEDEDEDAAFVTAPSTAAVVSPPSTASQRQAQLSTQRPSPELSAEDWTHLKLLHRRSMSLSSTDILQTFASSPLAHSSTSLSKPLPAPTNQDSDLTESSPHINSQHSKIQPPSQTHDLQWPSNSLAQSFTPSPSNALKEGKLKEEKPEVPPKPKRYEHVRAPSIGSSVSQPSTLGSGHGSGSGVYAHGKSSSHSNLLVSGSEREKPMNLKSTSPPSTMNNAGLRSRFAAWTGMGPGASPARKQGSASSISMSLGSGSVTSFSSSTGGAMLSSSPSSYAGSVPTTHSHLGGQPLYPPTHRQTTGSVSGLGPAAAGLAKRAVEKMGKKWGAKIGFGGPSSSSATTAGLGGDDGGRPDIEGGRKVKHKRTPNSKSGGWLPGAGAMFSGSGHTADGTGSSISSSIASLSPSAGGSTCATSMSGGSVGPEKGHIPATSFAGMSPASSGDPFSPAGPNLGRMVCGPFRAKGGVAFGRELKAAVADSKCVVIQSDDGDSSDDESYAEGEGDVSWSWSEDESGEQERRILDDEQFLRVKKTRKAGSIGDGFRKEGLVKRLENRELPAVVVRCAQHILLWGVREEGLFRVPGRPRHVTTLRQEFDAGADWDMTHCGPGDLDPHAVASVFKAFLRELPEPILTHKMQPYFDAAINKENSVNEQATHVSQPAVKTQPGMGLPSNPKSGHVPPGLRKPPSLSTLAMPTFSGLPPPSRSLINAIRSLISQLPAENRDLIRTVVDLIKATAREHKETKMPLSNLLLVFCPSLNMSPPLLKVLCEAPGIWPEEVEEGIVIDIRRKSELDQVDGKGEDDVPPPTPDKDGLQIEPGSYRREIPTVYLDTRSHLSSTSLVSSQMDSPTPASPPPPSSYKQRQRSKDDESVSSIPFSFSSNRNVPRTSSTPISSEGESVITPTSSANASYASLPLTGKRKNSNASISILSQNPSGQQFCPPQIVEPSSSPSPSPHDRKRPLISNPIPITGPVEFPSCPSPQARRREGKEPQPPTKRRSIPLLSLGSFSTSSGSSSSPKSGPNSPGPAISDSDSAAKESPKEPRMKKPSLKLLFSKKSSSSLKLLTDLGAGNSSSKSYTPLDLQPPNPPFYGSNRYASSERGDSPRSTSDSSISTPLSAVTAPQGNSNPGSSLSIPMPISKSSSYSSAKETAFASKPQTPVDQRSSVGKVNGDLTPSTATSSTMTEMDLGSPASGTTASMKASTPKADLFSSQSITPLLVNKPPRSDSLLAPSSPTSGRRSEEETARLRSRRGKHQQHPSDVSGLYSLPNLGASTMSLSLDGLGEGGDDWTSSVLLAADEAFGNGA